MKEKTNKSTQPPPLSPLIAPNMPVDWLFTFKFNAQEMPGDIGGFGKKGIFDASGIKRPKYDTKNSVVS